ncbi:unnamed protein product [Lepidochelys kempii]
MLDEAIAKVAPEDGEELRAPPRASLPRVPAAFASFPTDLEDFVQKSGQAIPLVVESCIRFINLHELECPSERVSHLHALLARLPGPVVVVLRYLFAFLNHVSQYSEENMMTPYNLAVCFGPTLAAAPPGLDPVSTQPHANEAVKSLILHPEATFPPPRPAARPPVREVPGAARRGQRDAAPGPRS